ncbi:ephrin-B2a-like isoform X1 [Acanthochromis polyacanthus]|uniref:ephrin-B2a-like isoform X1 n=1 Tax=Acanthochromis polyacanthus TaxID=80966 RepID=UPI0022348C1F|nr:ephrin-B2a-like isoform X1 [Acanthochromis polyacanthus]
MGRRTWSCAAVILLAVICSCRAATLESVHWSSSNAKFASGRGLVLYPQIGDKMDIVCPRADASPGGKEEFYRVYLVSKSQLASCTIDKTDTPLLNCDKPHRDVKFTFKFQEFSPNLWGLEFLKGKDYYITSTSTGSLQGLDNNNGGVCRTKSMKLVLRVGQNSSDPPSTLQESPTRFPPTRPKSKAKDASTKEKDIKSTADAGQTNPSSDPGLLVWIVSGCVVLVLVIAVVLVVLWRYHRRRCIPDTQQSASVSLNTLAVPKRDSISSDNAGSDRSDVVFPLRASDSMICRHYERVSGDYGPPVYIVQEIMPQSPTNIYYKV